MKTPNWEEIGETLQSHQEIDQRQKQEAAERSANELGKSLALETIVKALVAHMALDHERTGRRQAQAFVNILAEDCAKAIDGAQSESDTEQTKLVLVRARENINKLLAGIVLPKIQGGN
jgi:mannose/cellobiose epimerase-like protein (N-acyl-D-glucosamine 2-epimerase family)